MIRNLRSQIVASEELFNQVISEHDTNTQRESNNTTEDTTISRESIAFIYDFAVDMSKDSDDNVLALRKLQYIHQLKTYVTWQNEQRILTEIERDVVIKIAARRAEESTSAIVEKKSIIKILEKTLKNYKDNCHYAIYDEYIMKMKQQFDLNNVKHKKNMNSQKIDFAITFLDHTSKSQWNFYVRVNSALVHIWKIYKIFLRDRTIQSRLTHDQNIYDSWNDVKQHSHVIVSSFISYLNRLKFYLSTHMKHINYQMMNKFKNFVSIDIRTEMIDKKFIKRSVIYEKLQQNIIEIEFSLKQKKKIQIDESRKNKRNRSSYDDHNDRFNKFSRDSNRGGRGRDREDSVEGDENDNRDHDRDNRREDDRDREREDRNRRREEREDDTSATESNIDSVDRERKQKKREERQANESCYKCDFKSHWVKKCKKKSKN